MEQKILLGMLGGFIAFTVMAVVVVYSFSTDLSLASIKSNKSSPTITPEITIDPKPQPPITNVGKRTQTTPTVAGASTVGISETTIDPAKLYSLINAHRKEQGLSALRVHPSLEISSRRKLEDMRANKYWDHQNRDGVIDWSIFDQSGYHYASAGENLSFANNTAWAVFDSWVNSAIHNEQMLKQEYEDMGLAVDCQSYQVAGQNKCAVVLHLGKKM